MFYEKRSKLYFYEFKIQRVSALHQHYIYVLGQLCGSCVKDKLSISLLAYCAVLLHTWAHFLWWTL